MYTICSNPVLFSIQEEPTLPSSDQLTTSEQAPEITLTELNEKEILESQEDNKRSSSGGVVKRRKISRTDKEKVQKICSCSLSMQ